MMKLKITTEGATGMRRLMRWILLALAAMLLVAGVHHGLGRDASPDYAAGDGVASLGLVLLDDEDCVYVLAVTDQSPAHQAGLSPGDYILSAGGQKVENTAMLDEVVAAGWNVLEMTVRRQGAEMKLTIPVR